MCGCQGILSRSTGSLLLTVHVPCHTNLDHPRGHVFTPPSMTFARDNYIPEPLMNELLSEED